jgi:glycosyltransferase involved in cell wall biosynthesis
MTAPELVSSTTSSARVHVLEVVGNGIVGGMETCVASLIARLPRDRFVVSAACPYESPFTAELRAAGVDVLVLPMPDDPPWSSVQIGCALVRASGIDVLHAHLPNAHLLAGMVGKLSGKPVLTTIHGRQLQMPDLEAHRATGTFLGTVCRHSYYHALGLGIDARALSCIPNGIDTERYRPAEQRSGLLHAELALDASVPLVGFVGRLSPEKAPEVFVRAALLLRELAPQAHSVICGDGPMRASIEALVARCGLGERVHLLGVRRDMPRVYRGLDVCVCSSNSEAMPLALMEAMASALPVVATRVGGVPDLVEHGRTGWLVGPRDFEGIAHTVARLLANNDERRAMGQRARERAEQHFGIDDSVTRTAELLQRLAARPMLARAAAGAA